MNNNEDKKQTWGCLILVVVAFGLAFILNGKPSGQNKTSSIKSCIARETAAFHRRNPQGDMPRSYREQIVGGCMVEGEREADLS